MKLKDIENPQVMTINELNDLFKRWFPNGISKEEMIEIGKIIRKKYEIKNGEIDNIGI